MTKMEFRPVVIDSSVLLAIFLREPERESFLEILLGPGPRSISVASVLESAMVLESKRGGEAAKSLDIFLNQMGIEIIPFDLHQLELARSAWKQYGKGRHPAGLNFGDCICYALARFLHEPLLAKGHDFAKTDMRLVI